MSEGDEICEECVPSEQCNEHGPPSSAEEAAALLGAAISFGGIAGGDGNDGYNSGGNSGGSIANPPSGMHSIFTSQNPVPNGVLFVRLCNLRGWLRRHASEQDKETFKSGRSILAVLMKLLEITSSISSGDAPAARQHRPLPPLLSTPLRNAWVECVTLCLSLSSALPGNLRTDLHAFVTKMMEISHWNPRSKMAQGGVRLVALQLLAAICAALPNRAASYACQLLHSCHKGLLSGGAGEPGHRRACVLLACRVALACRPAEVQRAIPGAMEDRAVVESLKLVKRAASDKYPEVRMGAAAFAGLLAPLLLRSPSRSKEGEDSPLSFLEEVVQLAVKNVDDESAGVATAWAAALARCLCVSAEHGKNVRDAQSEDQASKRSVDVDDEAVPDSTNLDLAAKLKAFSESRRAAAITSVCSSTSSTIQFLVQQFVKCGGEVMAPRCGGSYSIGGRATRIGFADTLAQFLQLQGGASVEAVLPVMEMVGAPFEKQLLQRNERLPATSAAEDFYATFSSPQSTPEKTPAASISTAFLLRSTKSNWSDSAIARVLAARVLRRGICEGASEAAHLAIARELTSTCQASLDSGGPWNRHQLQVALVELSHLVVCIGEAGASSLQDLSPLLKTCLSHSDHGVRHEASLAFAALVHSFPAEGRVFVLDTLGGLPVHVDAIKTLSLQAAPPPPAKSRFRRATAAAAPNKIMSPDDLFKHQCALHGNALAISVLMQQFPHCVGGVAAVIVGKVFEVSQTLLQCQFDQRLLMANPSAACTCVRAGYCMLSGILSMGIDAVVPHIAPLFTMWQNTSMNVLPGISKLSPTHDLLVVETMLSSVVSFLKFCPNLLLAVPDALNRVTALLEKLFPLVANGGRLDEAGSRLSSARSSILEAYSWLPPGSFPLSADRIFSFASSQIQELSGNDVLCSILDSLVSKEDKLIETHSIERAVTPGQINGSVTLESNLSLRSADAVHHNEREAVIHLNPGKKYSKRRQKKHDHHPNHDHASPILKLYLEQENNIPTPLHEVGMWREPLHSMATSKVRLLDAAIHAFAATFGLQDGQTQAMALQMLEGLSSQMEKSRFQMSASLISESQGKVKPREEDVPSTNVTATILACLQALPLHEATYDTLIGVGPPWMERATALLLRLLPSPSDIVRRGAAEGLSYLATLGVSEDAHTLQSTILHSLDEVMKGHSSTTKHPAETLSYARSGSLLALACIQRAAKRLKHNEDVRASTRSVSRASGTKYEVDAPPFMIMMTRVLPSLTTQNPENDSLLVRTYALHSFGVLVSNSIPSGCALTADQIQILRKAVEAVETSFLGAWSAVVSDINKGKEREKFASEPAFLSVLLRLMTTLLPWLINLTSSDRWIASRFSCMASSIMECCSSHPVVLFEGAVFFERLSAHDQLVTPSACCVVMTHDTPSFAMPFLLSMLQPPHSKAMAEGELEFSSCCGPLDVRRSAILCLQTMCTLNSDGLRSFDLVKSLFSFLHDQCGRRYFQHFSDHRSLALSRAVVNYFEDCQLLEAETISLIHSILKIQVSAKDTKDRSYAGLRLLLLLRCLVAGDTIMPGQQQLDNSEQFSITTLIEQAKLEARREASAVLQYSNPPRWQLKCVASNFASLVINLLLSVDGDNSTTCPHFDYQLAQSRCIEVRRKMGNAHLYGAELHSYPIFHVEELVITSCSASAATCNHSELPSVQISGLRFLMSLFHAFGNQLDTATNDGSSVLNQFSSQIISAVKHALKSESETEDTIVGTSFHRLFSVGCQALLVMIKNGFVSDPVAMRRLLQPVLLSEEETVFALFPSSDREDSDPLFIKPARVTEDSRLHPLIRVSKLSLAAEISMSMALGGEKHTAASQTIIDLLEKNEEGRSIHSAASAIDGYILFHTRYLSDTKGDTISSGFTFKNRADLDDAVIQELILNWPTLSASAVSSLVKAIKATPEDSEKRKHLQVWVAKLAVIIVSGLRVALSKFFPLEENSNIPLPNIESAGRTAALCLYALRLIVRENSVLGEKTLDSAELGNIVETATDSVIFQFLGLPTNSKNADDPATILNTSNDSKLLVEQSCGLIEDLCQNYHSLELDAVILSRAVVCPLAALQEMQIKVGDDNISILSSCIRSCQSLLLSHFEEDGSKFERAMIQLSLLILKDSLDTPNRPLDQLKAPCLSLLRSCCENTTLTKEEWGTVARYTASNGLWDSWAVICSILPAGFGISCSIGAVNSALNDLDSATRHTSALVALRTALHSVASQNPSLVCAVLQNSGFEVLQLFRAHSLRIITGEDFDAHRATVCAESVKVNMIAFQYLNSISAKESEFVSFLSTIFDLLAECVSFNGYPNHPTGKDGADETIGKMCAQVFVHVARTNPVIFKAAMAALSEERRATLEAAVRADMSGYAAPKKGPAKKKISLKGFVR